MKPFTQFPVTRARRIRAVFTDIDDTLTTDGRLTAPAFSALWKLYDAGIDVVPVTGRPAGWCDHLARMWPVAGVVGENGAFYFRFDEEQGRLERRFLLKEEERANLQRRLERIRKRIQKAVPGAGIASDQPYRIHDLAIDFCEDVPPLPQEEIDLIVEIFQKEKATAKVSSIHVNGWFGTYDKLNMIKRFAGEVLGLSFTEKRDRDKALYVGDSPNDEPAFAFFENSIGVANIKAFQDQLSHPPAFVTRGRGGSGFAEVGRRLLREQGRTR